MTNSPLTLFYDGACPICVQEMARLSHRNRFGGLIFVDIAASGFDATRYGARKDRMLALMHAMRPDGLMLVGIDALHAAYEVVGLGWMWAPAKWPLLRPLADWLYARIARYRMDISRTLGFGCRDQSCRPKR